MAEIDETNIIHVVFRKKSMDGGKYRILRRHSAARESLRNLIDGLNGMMRKDDLTMDHADPEMPADSAP